MVLHRVWLLTIISGYGTAQSMIEMTPDTVDEGIVYTCNIDAAGKQSSIVKTLAVSFCK